MVKGFNLGERQVVNMPDALAPALEFALANHQLLRRSVRIETGIQAARPACGDLGSQQIFYRDAAALEHESSAYQTFGVRQHVHLLLYCDGIVLVQPIRDLILFLSPWIGICSDFAQAALTVAQFGYRPARTFRPPTFHINK